MAFQFRTIEISGPLLVEATLHADDRGFLSEIYRVTAFQGRGARCPFAQDNFSFSRRGVLRGLHYQAPPVVQEKLVRCLSGRIFDVLVDIRPGSATFGRWAGFELAGDNGLALYLPEGFAHGFLVLSDTACVLYKCSREYAPEHDRGIAWNDPDIGIRWPAAQPVLSQRDRAHPRLRDTGLAGGGPVTGGGT